VSVRSIGARASELREVGGSGERAAESGGREASAVAARAATGCEAAAFGDGGAAEASVSPSAFRTSTRAPIETSARRKYSALGRFTPRRTVLGSSFNSASAAARSIPNIRCRPSAAGSARGSKARMTTS
jgi:hypothetical protein